MRPSAADAALRDGPAPLRVSYALGVLCSYLHANQFTGTIGSWIGGIAKLAFLYGPSRRECGWRRPRRWRSRGRAWAVRCPRYCHGARRRGDTRRMMADGCCSLSVRRSRGDARTEGYGRRSLGGNRMGSTLPPELGRLTDLEAL
jgi:hypothetical protein